METYFLIGVSFLTSTFTGIIGIGGGLMLISVMPGLLPAAAIVPVHGAVQLASNSSRVFFGLRHIEWRIFWPFLAGAALGAIGGLALSSTSASIVYPCIWASSYSSSLGYPFPNALSACPATSSFSALLRLYYPSLSASPAP